MDVYSAAASSALPSNHRNGVIFYMSLISSLGQRMVIHQHRPHPVQSVDRGAGVPTFRTPAAGPRSAAQADAATEARRQCLALVACLVLFLQHAHAVLLLPELGGQLVAEVLGLEHRADLNFGAAVKRRSLEPFDRFLH